MSQRDQQPENVAESTRRRTRTSRSDGYVILPSEPEDGQPNQGATLQVPEQDDELRKRSSLVLPILLKQEKKFFNLVTAGDVNAVKEFLQENDGLKINCVDFKGLSALQVAVHNHNEDMVSFLLHQNGVGPVQVSDCALHAVRDNQPSILAMLLDSLAATEPFLEFAGCPASTDFPQHITPLMLAAQCGHYEIIEMLLQRGHHIDHPHHPRCYCPICQEHLKRDGGPITANERLNVYRAIINPAYICQTSMDPILTAFQLNKELSDCASTELQFRAAYLDLAKEVRAFAVELIGCCRDPQEVEHVLNEWAGCDFAGLVKFPRLTLAMDLNQKEFVAHPNTQEVLDTAWCGGWHGWRRRSELLKLLTVLPRMVLLPYIAAMCVAAPKSDVVAFHSIPVNKMLNSVASYLIFLILVFIESNQDKTNQKRGPPKSGLEPVLVVYVAAYIWGSTKHCMRQGPRRFFSVLANWYDMLMEVLFVVAAIFWLSAFIDVQVTGNADLERKYWHHLDHTLIAEGFFTVATIFAFGRLLLLMQLNLHLGPLQVSLGKMSKEIVKFFILMSLIVLAFCAGLCRFYQYYDGMIQEDKATGIKTEQVSSFVNIRATLKTLFWAIFCMSPIESADVVIENLPAQENGETVINKHDFTEAVGHICFALFEILIVFVIVNMMIAGLCNTMQKVIDNVNVEWTFGRTAVHLGYISQTILPPPFNLIPTAQGLISMAGWFKTCVKPTPGKQAKFSCTHCCYMAVDIEEEQKSSPELMATLCQRYLKQKEQETEVDSEIQALRQEVGELSAWTRKVDQRGLLGTVREETVTST